MNFVGGKLAGRVISHVRVGQPNAGSCSWEGLGVFILFFCPKQPPPVAPSLLSSPFSFQKSHGRCAQPRPFFTLPLSNPYPRTAINFATHGPSRSNLFHHKSPLAIRDETRGAGHPLQRPQQPWAHVEHGFHRTCSLSLVFAGPPPLPGFTGRLP